MCGRNKSTRCQVTRRLVSISLAPWEKPVPRIHQLHALCPKYHPLIAPSTVNNLPAPSPAPFGTCAWTKNNNVAGSLQRFFFLVVVAGTQRFRGRQISRAHLHSLQRQSKPVSDDVPNTRMDEHAEAYSHEHLSCTCSAYIVMM